jgi:hypothetical protein
VTKNETENRSVEKDEIVFFLEVTSRRIEVQSQGDVDRSNTSM